MHKEEHGLHTSGSYATTRGLVARRHDGTILTGWWQARLLRAGGIISGQRWRDSGAHV